MDNINRLSEKIEETFYEKNEGITPDNYDELTQLVPDVETLTAALPSLKETLNKYKKLEEECDKTAKENSAAKKMWKTRQEQVLSLLGHIMSSFNKKTCINGDIKASVTTRETLAIDEDQFLDMYRNLPEVEVFVKTMLPNFIKVTLSIDKTALKAHLKNDDSLVRTYPEILHPEQKSSTTLK